MSKSCECCKRYWTHLYRKVRCFVTQMNRHSRHSMVIPGSFVSYFAWKLSSTIRLEAPNGNVYDVEITERRNKTVLRSGWEAFVDANHIVENDLLMFRHRGSARFKVVVFDSSGCEKVVSCPRIESNSSEQEPSANSTEMSSSSGDSKTQSSGRGRSDGCQSGSSGHRRKRAKKDAISSSSEDLSGEESPYEHESSESDDHALPKPLYVLSGQCYVTEEDEENIVALVQETQPEMPLLVAMITQSNLKPYPDLVIPKDYTLAHFPRKNQTITLQLPGQSKMWHCEFRVRSDGGRCSLYECEFVRDNHLLDGDLCLFQPMKEGKSRSFKVMVHLLQKASVDHPSSGNFSNRGLPRTNVTSIVPIKEEPDEGEETFSSEHEEHGITEKSPNHDDADKTCDLPYMMSLGARLTEVQEKKVLEKIGAIASELPIYVAVMTKYSIFNSLTFSTQYAAMYLRNRSRVLALKLEGKSQTWHAKMHDKRSALRISGGWTSFASDNHLFEGDICIFQLMKNEGQPNMMVYVIRSEHFSGEEAFYSGHEEHGISDKSPNHDDPDRTIDLPYMMSLGARLTQVQEKKVLEKVGTIASELPIYVAVMTKTNVSVSLNFGAQYAAMYLRKGSRILALKLEGKSHTWHGKMRDNQGALRISGGWTCFASDNHLREGDICLFQLMKNEGQPKMMVYIIRSSIDNKTQLSGCGRSDRCQSGSSGHRRKRAKKDAISSSTLEDLSGEGSSSEHVSSESDDHALPKPPYVLSGQCYVTEEQEEKIVALVQETQPEMPLLVAVMTKPNLKPYPDLVIPKDYALAHFPHKNQTITLQLPGQSKKWHCEFHVRSDGGRCSLYECDFVRDNRLLEGDLCLFQLVKKAKGGTFKVMVHLLRKAGMDHPSSENIASTVRIKDEPDEGEETFSFGHEKHGISLKSPNHKTCDLPYMMALGARLTQVQENKVLEKVGAIASELPIYVAVMTKTNVSVSLSFGAQYAAMYLRKGSWSLALKLEGKSQTWHGKMHDHKGALRISGGWTSFARDNHLQERDICLFQLMKNEGQPKMTVSIIRREHC